MKEHRSARLVVLCAGVAALLGAGVWLLGVIDPASSAPPAVETAAMDAQNAAPPSLAEQRDAGLRAEGALEVLVRHSGEAQAGAEVRLYSPHGVVPGTGAPGWRLLGSRTTGVDGVAAFPTSPGTYLVAARAAGLAPRLVTVRRGDEAWTPVTVSLVQAVAVGGRVLARGSGEPVPFAALSLVPSDESGPALPIPAEERESGVSDASGGFRFELAPGSYWLEASATGFARARVKLTAPRAALEVRLASAAVVEGFVHGPDGAPAAGAEVLLGGGEKLVRGRAGSSGGFAVEVTPGSYSVTARSDRLAGAWPVPVAVAAGERARGIDIVLGSPAAVAGVVAEDDGAKVQGASVTVSPHDASGEVARAVTDARGRFAVETLGAGIYDVGVTADGWTGAVRRGVALLAGERADLAIALRRSGGIQGTVKDGAGHPLAGVRVRVRAARQALDPSGSGAETRTDEAGNYRLGDLEAGPCDVTAARDDANSGASASVAVPPGSFATADFTLAETGWLQGFVTRRDRGPVDRAVVVAFTPGSALVAASAKVEADGRYSLRLAPAEYRAAAVPSEGASLPGPQRAATVRIAPGAISKLDLFLKTALDGPEALAVVQVMEPGGSASAGSLVIVTTADDLHRAGAAFTDEEGFAQVDLTERTSLLVRAFRGGRVGGPVPLVASGPTVVALRAASRLRGQVVAPDGPAPSGFTLELVALGNDASVASTIGGADGVKSAQGVQAPRRLEFAGDRFELADIPAGPVRVAVQTPMGRLARAELELAPGEVREVELVLEPGATVEGRVVEARSRSSLPGASVIVLIEERAPSRAEVTTDAAGRFRLTGLQPGAHRLRVAAPDYAAVELDVEVDQLGNVDLGDIALAGAPEARGGARAVQGSNFQ